MRRRDFLAAGGLTGLGALAGCSGFRLRSSKSLAPPLVENRPDGVYFPTHYEEMAMVGTASAGPYRCALTYTYPHRFWLVTGSHRQKVDIEPEDSVHLMPVVWHADASVLLPDANPQISLSQGGETVESVSPWPMISQPMGIHFGDNVALDGEGTYDVSVHVGEPSARRTGSLADADDVPRTFEFSLEFSESTLNEIPYHDIDTSKQGTRGAVEPSGMQTTAMSQAPDPGALPGTVRGSATSGDATFVVTTVEGADDYGGSADQTYLAASARTPFNRYVLPAMSVSATLDRDGETVFDGPLHAALDPDLDYHYGAAVSGVESGDELTLAVDAPPQTARHEGYETAFLEMDPMTITL